MKKIIYAMICMLLIVSTPFSSAVGFFDDPEDPRNLGEALIIEVDDVEPTPIRTDYFANKYFDVIVNLKGKTLGTMLFGDSAPDQAPFYGDLQIRDIQLRGDTESAKYVSELSPIIRPKGKNLIIDSDGNIDLGYTKVRIKRMPNEDEVPDEITIDVSAKIYFDVTTGFGDFGTFNLNLNPSPESSWMEDPTGKIWGGEGLH